MYTVAVGSKKFITLCLIHILLNPSVLKNVQKKIIFRLTLHNRYTYMSVNIYKMHLMQFHSQRYLVYTQ